MKNFFFVLISFLGFLSSCSGGLQEKNEVIVHELSDPEMLNPVNYTDATAGYITANIFQRLLDFDFRNPEQLIPVLAISRPQVEITAERKMLITYELRKEAKWDNGTPVTAKDVEFTIKTIKCPLVNNPNAKSYYEFISGFQFYDDNPLKFTIVSNEIYFLAEYVTADLVILPEYFYDSLGLMRNFTVEQIASDSTGMLASDEHMKKFADDFNSERRMREPEFISGSGPYLFDEWKTGERVVLVKKENWWGDALEKENCHFEAHPEKLIYQVIKDQTTAIVSLKAGNLDVMRTIKSKDFAELTTSKKFTENFNTYTPMMIAYTYLGLNVKSPLLKEKETRQALAHLVNVDEMITTIKYGQAQRVVGPIHPAKKSAYNDSIVLYDFNPGKAKQLLAKAGWGNSNANETLDKKINGVHTEFVIEFLLNSESDERKAVALMLQQEAKKLGIKINITSVDWSVFLPRCKNHEFDLMMGFWVGAPTPDDFKQIFHCAAASGEGSNYVNFCHAEADSLIEKIRRETDENKRAHLYKRLQEIFHEEAAYIFLWSPTERIAISKKFDNAYPSVYRPGYREAGFKIK